MLGRGDAGTLNGMTRQGFGNEAGLLRIFHKRGQRCCGRGASRSRRTHCLSDQHEVPRKKTQAFMQAAIRLELLTDARSHIQVVQQEFLDHRRRRRRSDNLGVLQLTRKVQVVRTAASNLMPAPGFLQN